MRAIISATEQSDDLGGNFSSSSSSSSSSAASKYRFEIVAKNTDLFVLNLISVIDSLVIIIGTIGNLTSLYLLTRKRLRPVSSMRYLAALTLVDTVCLYGWYLSSVYRQLNGDHLRRLENLSPVLCKLIAYMSFSSLQLSSILLCMLTIDRFLIIVASKWRQKYANAQFANWVILGLAIAVLALNMVIPIRLGNLGMVEYRIVRQLSSPSTSSSSSSASMGLNPEYSAGGGDHFHQIVASPPVSPASPATPQPSTMIPQPVVINPSIQSDLLPPPPVIFAANQRPFVASSSPSSNIHFDSTSFIHHNNDNFTIMCHCYDDNDPVLQLWHKVHLIIYSLAPFPLLCVLNFIVVRKTRDAAKSAAKTAAKSSNSNASIKLNHHHHHQQQQQQQHQKTIHTNSIQPKTLPNPGGVSKSGQRFVTRLLLFLTISFLLTTLPSTIVYTYWHREILQLAHGRVYLNLLNTLQFSRHSSNWIIYIYSSSFMREELKRCLACISEGDMGDEELARNVLAQRPSVALELLRQLEAVGNNNTTADLDSLYLKFYMQQQLQKHIPTYTRTPVSDSDEEDDNEEFDEDNDDDSDDDDEDDEDAYSSKKRTLGTHTSSNTNNKSSAVAQHIRVKPKSSERNQVGAAVASPSPPPPPVILTKINEQRGHE